jgi:hypothetical protein
MDEEGVGKPLITHRNEASGRAARGAGGQRPPKPLVGGSIPSGPAK